MLCSKVVVFLLVCLFAIVRGMPQNGGNSQDSSGLPLIQFTNGGIRFNFGGYHAAAGLGGLLGGSRTGGGLHASVGTPWGGHAGAGLGGILGGDDASAGGGLYARAGLGNGRSEVGAGLGGLLDGSGRSATPASGGLFAGAKVGDHGVGVSAGSGGSNGSNEPGSSQGNAESDGGKANKGTSNIQIISHGGKKQHKIKQALSEASSTETSKQIVPAASKEVREVHSDQSTPPAAASVFNPLSAIPVPQTLGGAILEAPLAPPLPNQVNEVQPEQRPQRVKFGRPIWRVRKRLWGPTKYITINSSVESQETPQIKDRKLRQVPNYNQNRPTSGSNGMPVQNGNNGGFFDDIFKIPISTLGAVNTFLNNNAS